MSRWYLLLLLLVAVVFIPHAEARTVNDIGIDISKKCEILIKNNINNHLCPTREELLALYPDTSPRQQIGGFDYIDGVFKRVPIPTNVQLCRNYIQGLTDVSRIWIDPPGCIRDYIKMITIESNFVDYPLVKQSYDMSNHTITVGNQRWVAHDCSEALVNAASWVYITGDTMQLLFHNCDPKFTNFDSTKTYQIAKPYHDLTTSSKWKLEEFVNAAITKYKTKSYIGTNDTMENRAVTTDEDQR